MDEKIIIIDTERALTLCARSLGEDKNSIRNDLNNLKAEAFIIGQCCFITRFETTDNNKELIVMCAEGKGLNQAGSVLKKIAKAKGCNSARMHTKRPALQRLAKKFGWIQKEIIFTTVI